MTLRDRLRHAFAVDPPGAAKPAADQKEAVDRFCRSVARRHLTLPGVTVLEMCRPLNYLASQVLHVAEPGVWALAPAKFHDQYQRLAAFLERRGSLEYLAQRIEHFERLYEAAERAQQAGPGGPGGDDEAH